MCKPRSIYMRQKELKIGDFLSAKKLYDSV